MDKYELIRLHEALRVHRLGFTGYLVLLYSSPQERTVCALADLLGISIGGVSSMLAALHARGLLRPEVDPDDRRLRRYTLTPSGRAALREIHEHVAPSEIPTQEN